MPTSLIVLIALAIVFDFLNGVHDSSNIAATMISSRAIQPRVALAMTAVAEFLDLYNPCQSHRWRWKLLAS